MFLTGLRLLCLLSLMLLVSLVILGFATGFGVFLRVFGFLLVFGASFSVCGLGWYFTFCVGVV